MFLETSRVGFNRWTTLNPEKNQSVITHATFGFVKKEETERSKKSGWRNTFIQILLLTKCKKCSTFYIRMKPEAPEQQRHAVRKIREDESQMKGLLLFGEVLDQEVKWKLTLNTSDSLFCLFGFFFTQYFLLQHFRLPPIFSWGFGAGRAEPPLALGCLRAGRRAGPRGVNSPQPLLRFLSDH